MIPGGAIAGALQELRQRLRDRFGERLERLVLFGSYARGEAGPDSDVDVLVVVRGLTGRERTEVYELGADLALDRHARLAPLAFSDAEAGEMRRLERLLWQDIEREGVPLD
ncbi:MAG TPA: nucleotidyltransferase domain-containing protein [Polyangia bacterium]|jgi:predicted nucleotidyltransferase